MTRLLISARDPAAAFHLIEIIRLAQGDPGMSMRIVAQAPAADYLHSAGIPSERVSLPIAKSPESGAARALLDFARGVLREFRPDAVLCGLSTPFDGGIDEALLAAAEVPTFLFQDFWGEQNSFFGKGADRFLVLDEEAARLSRLRHGTSSVVVGSPRHASYARRDLLGRRRELRRQLGVAETATVLGFFGQALHKNAGYVRTARAWAEAVKGLPPGHRALYKPHPREREEDRRHTREIFAASGLDCIVAGDWSVEDALLLCDVACSAFSNCTYDAAYLNRFSPVPLITPVSLFFDPEVVGYFRQIVHLQEFPYLKAGLVLPIEDGAALRPTLAAAARPETKRRFWEAARTQLLDPADAPARVLGAIAEAIDRQGPRAADDAGDAVPS